MIILLQILAGKNKSRLLKEIEIMENIKLRDEKALSELYTIYSKIIYSLIYKIVKKQDEAEDILQSVFLQIWNKAYLYNKEKGNVYSWIVRMSRNKALDHIRSKKALKSLDEIHFNDDEVEVFIDNCQPIDAAIAEERSNSLATALNQIPNEQREIIEMSYYQGYTHQEISTKFNIPLGTVKTRMRQGMKKLYTIYTKK